MDINNFILKVTNCKPLLFVVIISTLSWIATFFNLIKQYRVTENITNNMITFLAVKAGLFILYYIIVNHFCDNNKKGFAWFTATIPFIFGLLLGLFLFIYYYNDVSNELEEYEKYKTLENK